MTTLLRERRSVHPIARELPDDCEPFISPEDASGPTPADEAYWVAFNAALSGDVPDCPGVGPDWTESQTYGFCRGSLAGRRERERAAAYAIGKTLGVISDICCPPAGYGPHEANAYRSGFADGRRDFDAAVAFEAEEEARTEAQIKHMEAERLGDALGRSISDADVYPMGCMS